MIATARRVTLAVASFFFVGETAILPLDRAVAAERPSFLLMMCDDLGWGDVGFNGNAVIRTPHLDEMAAAGLKFDRFYAAAPVCSPTRGSCLTGRHPFRYGVHFANVGHLRAEELTLAELLREQGYATGHFGKWHLGTFTTTEPDANRGGPRHAEHFSRPQDNGFDVCFSTESKVPTWGPMIKPKNAPDKWWDPVSNPSRAVPYGTAYWDQHGRRVTKDLQGDDSRIIIDRVVPFLRQAVRAEQPFFAVVWFHTPHLPVVAGPEYTAMYADHDPFARHYYGCITAMDEQVGRLRQELRRLGVAENTLITFCSDNGPEGTARIEGDVDSGQPGSAGPFRGRKRSLYEGGIRVPGLIEWPARIAGGRTTDFPAVTSDYLPTILEIVGASLPDDRPLDGVSLVPVLAGRMRDRPCPIGFQSGKQRALIANRHKLISPDNGRTWELYDLPGDPRESENVAAALPERVRTMRQELDEWIKSCQLSEAGADYEQ